MDGIKLAFTTIKNLLFGMLGTHRNSGQLLLNYRNAVWLIWISKVYQAYSVIKCRSCKPFCGSRGWSPGNFEKWNLGNLIPYNLGIQFLAAVLVTSLHLATPQPRSALRNFNSCEKWGGGHCPLAPRHLTT